jgi:hypothetical protein
MAEEVTHSTTCWSLSQPVARLCVTATRYDEVTTHYRPRSSPRPERDHSHMAV